MNIFAVLERGVLGNSIAEIPECVYVVIKIELWFLYKENVMPLLLVVGGRQKDLELLLNIAC